MRQKQNLQTQPVVIESRYLVTRIFLITKSSLLCDAIDLTQTLDNIILQILFQESALLRVLPKICSIGDRITIIPKVHHRGVLYIGDLPYDYIVQQRCGPSLRTFFIEMKTHFTFRTISLIAIKMISLLQILHSHGLVHRNLRLSTILTSRNSDLYLSNFENSARIGIPCKQNRKYVNRFSSLGCHLNQNPCARDDLESLAYILIYLVSGGEILPSKQAANREDKLKYYYDFKNTFVGEISLKKYPDQVLSYYQQIKSLFPKDHPNYDQLKQPFLKSLGTDLNFQFDWIQILNEFQKQQHLGQQILNNRFCSQREFDKTIFKIGSESEFHQSSSPCSPTSDPWIGLNTKKRMHKENSKLQQPPGYFLPPILEKNESTTTHNKLFRDDRSSSGNVSSDGEEQNHVDMPPEFSVHNESTN